MYHSFFIHSSCQWTRSRLLSCSAAAAAAKSLWLFHVLAVANSATVNNGIHVSFSILISSGHMPKSGIAGSYGGFIPNF